VTKLGLIGGAGSAAFVALALVLTPAIAASTDGKTVRPRPAVSFRSGGFTPAISDPRLAAELARRGLQANSFRLTPSTVALGGSKSVRVAIRARAATADAVRRVSEPSAAAITAITPAVYNLGVSIGWKRFALSGDVDHIRGGAVPGGRQAAEVGVSYVANNRITGRVELGAARADPDTPRLITEDSSYTVGVGGSYRLTHNLDVTGGVRYKIQRDRLETLSDQRRDSQAVYIGTAFRF
jgi:hypothetical protein